MSASKTGKPNVRIKRIVASKAEPRARVGLGAREPSAIQRNALSNKPRRMPTSHASICDLCNASVNDNASNRMPKNPMTGATSSARLCAARRRVRAAGIIE